MNKPFWWPDLPGMFAFALLGLLSSIVVALLFFNIMLSAEAWGLLTTIAGVLIAKVGTIADFFFGGSHDSKEKDRIIGKIANGETNRAP